MFSLSVDIQMMVDIAILNPDGLCFDDFSKSITKKR